MPLFFQDPLQRAPSQGFHSFLPTIYEDFLNRDGVERFLNEYDREASRKGGWFWYKQNKALQYFNLLNACHLVGGIYRKERSEVLVIA